MPTWGSMNIINVKCHRNGTALNEAVVGVHAETILFLLENGTETPMPTNTELSPYLITCGAQHARMGIALSLLDTGAGSMPNCL